MMTTIADYYDALRSERSYHEGAAPEKVYEDMSDSEIDVLIEETWPRPYGYAPFTQFVERPSHGSYVNVDDNAYRITKNQGP